MLPEAKSKVHDLHGSWIDLCGRIFPHVMKSKGNPSESAATRIRKRPALSRLNGRLFLCLLLAGCNPSPKAVPPPAAKDSAPPPAPTSVVSIPEEFLAPLPAEPPKPPAATPEAQPATPRVLFVTSDFQLTTEHGIQGVRAGEAVDFVREEGGDFVVRYRGQEFRRNSSYFAETYVEPPRPGPTPFAGENPAVANQAPVEPQPADAPALSGPIPGEEPSLAAGQKKLAELTDTIRTLNNQIRSAQEDLDRKSAGTSGGEAPSSAEVKKASRAIQRLKEKRDEFSGQLTEMGKP